MSVVAPTVPRARAAWVLVPLLAAFLGLGGVAVYRYVDNFWLYRGFAPPRDPAWVETHGTTERIYVTSAALGGRSQPVDLFLPPGYAAHPHRRYGVMYLLHGVPGRPAAFLETVRMGVVEDELVALHRARSLILVMPFGSTGSFTDKEWANGVGRNQGWATFVSRDLVRAIDKRFRTIPSPRWRVLAGLSEGGYGALNIGLAHPHEFGVLESWSGYALADADRVDFRPWTETASRKQPARHARRVGTGAASRARVHLVLQRQRRSLPPAERRLCRCARPSARRAPLPHRARGAQLGALARQCVARLHDGVAASRERRCVEQRPSPSRSPS